MAPKQDLYTHVTHAETMLFLSFKFSFYPKGLFRSSSVDLDFGPDLRSNTVHLLCSLGLTSRLRVQELISVSFDQYSLVNTQNIK